MNTTRDIAAPARPLAGMSRGAAFGVPPLGGCVCVLRGRGGRLKAELQTGFAGNMALSRHIARGFRTPGLSRTARRAGFALRASAERLGGQVLSSGPLANGSASEFCTPGLRRTARAGSFALRAYAERLL